MPLLLLVAMVALVGWVDGGPLPGLLAAALALAIVVRTVRRAIDRSLPREPSVEPLAEVDLLPATAARIRDLRALGFEPLGGPHVANLSPAPVVVPFVHRSAGVLAAVYQVRNPVERSVLDFVTTFASGAMLTTASSREAATLPLPPGCFLQTVHDADTAALLERHRQGMATLQHRGERPRATAATTLAEYLQRLVACLRDQRAAFERAPLRTTLTALLRSLLRLDPARGPLQPRQV